jgi:hypothetical protein
MSKSSHKPVLTAVTKMLLARKLGALKTDSLNYFVAVKTVLYSD